MNGLGRALGYLRPYRAAALGALVSLLLVSAANLITPQILRVVVDRGISARNLETITYAALALLAVAAVRGIFSFFQTYLSEKASQGAAYDLRNTIFAHLQRLSFSYHDQAQTGQLMTRVTSDVDLVRNFTGMGFLQLLNALVLLVGSLVILFAMNWRLAVIALVMVPAILLVFFAFFRRVGPRFRVMQQKLGHLNTVLQEYLAGLRVVRAFVREPYELQRYRQANADLLQENLAIVRGASWNFPMIFLFANLGTLAVVWLGGEQVIGGTLSLGELVAFNTYLSFLIQPIFVLGTILIFIAQAAASAQRVFEVVDSPIEVMDAPNAMSLPKLHGRVVFEDVSFRYAGSDQPSLAHVSFVVEPGQTVAIIGPTGAGKSTVINLIPRLYDVTGGHVMVDGLDVRHATLASLRGQIAIVLQETTLFSGTIRENIAYGRLDATEAEIEAAAHAAQAHDFISQLPDGYATIVGERGVGLSGGQRQRIAIARALITDPALLILDDSTSAVDATTEYQIQQALEHVMAHRTTFIIAQRISTVRTADLILVLERGRLVAQGTHEQLLRSSPLYAAIVESQLRGETVQRPLAQVSTEGRR